MSVYTFITSDRPLHEVAPKKEYPLVVNVDEGTIYDGGTDDNFFFILSKVSKGILTKSMAYIWYGIIQTDVLKQYWSIRSALEHEAVIELRHVWLMDYYEYDERPVIQRCTVSLSEMTVNDIKEIDDAVIWNKSDKRNPGRPSFFCLVIEQ